MIRLDANLITGAISDVTDFVIESPLITEVPNYIKRNVIIAEVPQTFYELVESKVILILR